MNREREKILKFNRRGGQNNRGSEFEKRLTTIIKRQKQDVIKQKTKRLTGHSISMRGSHATHHLRSG